MPICPNCKQEIARLWTSPRIDLVWYEDKWLLDFVEQTAIVCPNCGDEMGYKDIDELGIPLGLR